MDEEGVSHSKPAGESIPPPSGNPSFLSVLRASHETVKLYVGLIVLIGGVPAAVVGIDNKYNIHELGISTAFCLVPALLILIWLVPKWREQQNKRRAIEFGIRGQVKNPEYFRLTSYETDTDFRRADGFHDTVYAWITKSTAPLLYLSGASGSGKSSIISGWVLPKLIKDGVPTRVVRARVAGNPMFAISQALLQPGAIWERAPPGGEQDLRELLQRSCKQLTPRKLLLVLDQFEEFLILSEREHRTDFVTLLRSLAESPPPNIQILMILRSDYRPLLDELGLPQYDQDRKEVPPFLERDAMAFLRASELKLSDALESEIRQEARDVEQTPGLIRPITINLFGLVLRRFDVLPKNYRKGTLLRSYLRELIQKKEIRGFAPQILRCMITDSGTKLPLACAELAGTLGLDPLQVRGCLVQLGNDGIVRELDRDQNKWEIAHDFIAGLYFQILAGWRASVWRRGRPWIIGAGIGLWLVAVLSLLPFYSGWRETQAVHALAELGLFSRPCGDDKVPLLDRVLEFRRHPELQDEVEPYEPGCTEIAASESVNAATLGAAVPYLNRLPRLRLNLTAVEIENVDALKGLTGAQVLNLRGMPVKNIDALKEFSGLQQLGLSRTKVENLDALKGLNGLQRLDLASTSVENIDALKGLSGLRRLNLTSTRVKNLDALKGLNSLQRLDLAGTSVENIDALKGLSGLQRLNLTFSKIQNIDALKRVSGLQRLSLAMTKVENVDALKGLSRLQELDLHDTNVKNIDALKGLNNLLYLDLRKTNVENIDALNVALPKAQITWSMRRPESR